MEYCLAEEVLIHAVTQMNLKSIILSEKIQIPQGYVQYDLLYYISVKENLCDRMGSEDKGWN